MRTSGAFFSVLGVISLAVQEGAVRQGQDPFVRAWDGAPRANIIFTQSVTRAAAANPVACTSEALGAGAPEGMTILKAARVPARDGLPEFCQADGQVATPGNLVNVRLRLPATWNGKFYFHGVGAFAGSVEPPQLVPTNVNTAIPGLVRGYATASTDTGHQGATREASWALNNRAKELDYAHRGTHAATVAAKTLTAAYYGVAPLRSYFVGCSNGGAQALMEAQRYPEDFNGIVAGAPSFRTFIGRTLAYQALLASLDAYIPAAKLDAISRAVLTACDALDGLADGLVSDPPSCTFKPETLLCPRGDGPDCLTKGQVETLKKLYSGSSRRDGKFKIPGFPVGHEAGSTGWQRSIVGATFPERRPDGTLVFTSNPPSNFELQDQYLRYLAFETDEPNYDWRRFNLDREAPRLEFMWRILRPTDPNLRPFRARGGKLIMYHGWADPSLSAYETLGYYDQVVRAVGGKPQADSFVRLFLAPGMHHCGGGPGPNSFVSEAVAALEAWVEQGKAPDAILATHVNDTGVVGRTRPLCPWPQVAKYKGTGSSEDAANFVCTAP